MTYDQKQKLNQRNPNFNTEDGWFLVRCFSCEGYSERGRENYAPSVATGQCAWCGFDINRKEDDKQ